MKNELLSIGEVSRMKGVSPKSLRYYEQLGILTPARVDEHSGYRYYAMSQMIVVDVIITCIELGIPPEIAHQLPQAGRVARYCLASRKGSRNGHR